MIVVLIVHLFKENLLCKYDLFDYLLFLELTLNKTTLHICMLWFNVDIFYTFVCIHTMSLLGSAWSQFVKICVYMLKAKLRKITI